MGLNFLRKRAWKYYRKNNGGGVRSNQSVDVSYSCPLY